MSGPYILVVEDEEDIREQIREAITNDDIGSVIAASSFEEGKEILASKHVNLLILDLKNGDDDGSQPYSGEKVFEELKRLAFIPVVFYTALPSVVKPLCTSFVSVVEKTQGVKTLRKEVKSLLANPAVILADQLKNKFKTFMWDVVAKHWKEEYSDDSTKDELPHIIVNHLFDSLSDSTGAGGDKAIPMLHYNYPPKDRPIERTGDIVVDCMGTYWVLLSSTCDFKNQKIEYALFAPCIKVANMPEYKNWKQGTPITETIKRYVEDKKGPVDRFKFLPGTFFIESSVIDFQQVKSFSKKEMESMKLLTSLASPYSQTIPITFARYYGRVVLKEIDVESAHRKINQERERSASQCDFDCGL